MALTDCPECKKQISTQATACPHCGADVKTYMWVKAALEEEETYLCGKCRTVMIVQGQATPKYKRTKYINIPDEVSTGLMRAPWNVVVKCGNCSALNWISYYYWLVWAHLPCMECGKVTQFASFGKKGLFGMTQKTLAEFVSLPLACGHTFYIGHQYNGPIPR